MIYHCFNNLYTVLFVAVNYMDALVNYNMITQRVGDVSTNTTSRRRKRAVADTTSATAAEQLDLMENIIDSTVLDTSTAQLQIDQLQFMVVSDLTLSDQSKYFKVILFPELHLRLNNKVKF